MHLKVVTRNDAVGVHAKRQNELILNHLVQIDLKEATPGVVPFSLHLQDELLLDVFSLCDVLNGIDEALSTRYAWFLRLAGKHAAKHHEASAGAPLVLLLLEEVDCFSHREKRLA